jgi:hypothetical protein
MLTTQQIQFFETFGFLLIRQLFSSDEIDLITSEFEKSMLAARNGQPVNIQVRQEVNNWYEGRQEIAFLTEDQRIQGPIKALLGPEYSFSKYNDGNFYVGDTLWHPDLGWDPHIPDGINDKGRASGQYKNHYIPSIQVAFYLDPVDKYTGCLRVIPGAHRSPFHEQFWSLHANCPSAALESPELRHKLAAMWKRYTGSTEGVDRFLSNPKVNHFGIGPENVPSFPIKSEPGDAGFFSHQLWHSSFGGAVGRRMFTLNFRSAQTNF